MADVGIKFDAEGYSEFKKNLKDCQDNLRVMGSSLKEVKSQFDKNDTSVSALTRKNEALDKSIKAQKEQVDLLAKGVKSATDEWGANDKRTQDLIIKYNNAKTVLNKLTLEYDANAKAIDGVGNEAKETGAQLEKAEKSTNKFAAALRNGLKDAAKVAATAVAAAAAGVAAITKGAVESYAEYEQLMGGVDTLFKESSGKVQEYAANAFKTAGLSANDYMTTVTSFSASLLQSLSGDTEKAADAANSALVDMSDNANKMGTDMGSIQYAYQGFAKQNYTMLDNLKLGYGGTKEEMKRLLEDAEKLSGIRYDMSNLSDVYSAIHVIQTEIGITGTTAKEASTTIEGSVSAMKSAWKNALVGMADDKQDFDMLINNLVESVSTAGKNIMPRIEIALSGIGKLITSLSPIIASEIPQLVQQVLPTAINAAMSVVSGVAGALPDIVKTIANVIPNLLSGASDLFKALFSAAEKTIPQFVELGVQVIPLLAQGILEAIPQLSNAAIQMIGGLAQYLSENLPQMIQSGLEYLVSFSGSLRENAGKLIESALAMIQALADGIIASLPVLIANVPVIIDNFVNIINDNMPKILKTGLDILIALVGGIIDSIPIIIENIPMIIKAIVDTILAFDWLSLGSKIINGIGSGIRSMASGLKDFVTGGFSNAIEYIRELPSRALTWGSDFIHGFIDGFTSGVSNLVGKVKDIAGKIRSFLHFSRPDEGPLRDYETWMPDFVNGMAAGISKNSFRMYDAIGELAGGMESGINGRHGLRASVLTGSVQNEAMNRQMSAIASYLPQILSKMDMSIVLDDGTLVGKLAPAMNDQIGRINTWGARGR